MRMLITGGTGFIGSRLALRCLGEGHIVSILDPSEGNDATGNAELLGEKGAAMIHGSVTDDLTDRIAFNQFDVVFHLAAAQHEMGIPDERFWQVNVDGTKRILESSLRGGVARVVHASTIGVYGNVPGLIDETTPCKPDNIYGQTKLEGEKVALSFSEQMPVAVLRLTETYGPRDRRLLKLFRVIKKGAFFMIGSGSNTHQPLYVDDCVEGLLLAAEHKSAGGEVLLLAGKDTITTSEMVATIARGLGKEAPKLRIPLLPFSILAFVMEKTLRPLGIQPPLHTRRLDFFRKSFRFSIQRAQEKIDFQPGISFEEGVRRTAAFYQDSGWL